MIVRKRPGTLAMLVTMRGSVVPRILPHILAAAGFAAFIVTIQSTYLREIAHYTIAPFTLFGISLSIFLGFRNNAAYDRWWEARKQWGQMVYEVRSLARVTGTLLPESQIRARQALLANISAHSHALRGMMRGESTKEDLRAQVGTAQAARAMTSANPADYFLRTAGDDVGQLYRDGLLDTIGVQIINQHLTSLASVQAACERINNTPLPFAYTLLVHRTAYLYCYLLPFGLVGSLGWLTPVFTAIVAYTFFGLDSLSEELEDPFGRAPNDLALDAICRVIDISIAEALGDEPPEPLQPVNAILQ